MARKGQRRRSRLNVLKFSGQVALDTLGNDIAIGLDTPDMAEDYYIQSIDVMAGLRGLTATEGPVEIGVAHGDYSVTEITEALNVSGFDPDDKIAQERVKRKVRSIGLFATGQPNQNLNDGKPVRVKCKFVVGNSKPIRFFAVNRSGAALTTGSVVEINSTIYGRWIR